MLAFAEVIGMGAVSGIGGLFRSHREILVETGTIHVSALTAVTDGGASDADIRSFGAGVLTTE